MSHHSTAFVLCATLDCGEGCEIELEGQYISRSQVTQGAFENKWGRVDDELACPQCIHNALKNLKRKLADYGSGAVVVYTDLRCDGENCDSEYQREEPNKRPQRDVRMARLEASCVAKWRYRKPNFDFCQRCDDKLQAWMEDPDRQIAERKRQEAEATDDEATSRAPVIEAGSDDPDEAKILKVSNLENTQHSALWPEEQYGPKEVPPPPGKDPI